MSIYGYRLAGNAKSMSPDYIPSLIGIDQHQIAASPNDTYFERVDYPAATDLNLNAISATRWVSYDTNGEQRDPILAIKAGPLAFYSTLSEIAELVDEFGTDEDHDILRAFMGAVHA